MNWTDTLVNKFTVSGDTPVSRVDDYINDTRIWVRNCLEDISGYPYNTYLIMYKWTSGTRPSGDLKVGMMGYNETIKKFEMWNGSTWRPLEYDAYCCGYPTQNGNVDRGTVKKAEQATKATKDGKGNVIDSTYVKLSQIQTYASNNGDRNKIVKFNGSKIQFPNGAQFWVN